MKKRRLIIFSILFLLTFFQLTSAGHDISPSSFSVNIEKVSSFSISVTNTDTNGADANITAVEITLPSSLKFIAGTNSTDSSANFVNTSTTLTWTNSTYLIGVSSGGDNTKSFSFNANATTFGSFNITLKTTNSSGTISQNISLIIADEEDPEVTLLNPLNNAVEDNETITFECDAEDDYKLSSISFYIYCSNNSICYQANTQITGKENETNWEYTFELDDQYKWNCRANDTSGNVDWGSNRTIEINTAAACTPNWNCGAWGTCLNDLQTRTCTDSNNCGVSTNKPSENQTCISCTPDWNCTTYSPIKCPKEEIQTRTCTDSNNCDDNTNKPAESMSCEYISSAGFVIVVIIIVILIVGASLIAIFLYLKKDEVNNIAEQNTSNNQNSNYMSP